MPAPTSGVSHALEQSRRRNEGLARSELSREHWQRAAIAWALRRGDRSPGVTCDVTALLPYPTLPTYVPRATHFRLFAGRMEVVELTEQQTGEV